MAYHPIISLPLSAGQDSGIPPCTIFAIVNWSDHHPVLYFPLLSDQITTLSHLCLCYLARSSLCHIFAIVIWPDHHPVLYFPLLSGQITILYYLCHCYLARSPLCPVFPIAIWPDHHTVLFLTWFNHIDQGSVCPNLALPHAVNILTLPPSTNLAYNLQPAKPFVGKFSCNLGRSSRAVGQTCGTFCRLGGNGQHDVVVCQGLTTAKCMTTANPQLS